MPGTGTFLSRDAWEGNLHWPQSMNGYGYVGGNPIRYTDPTGLCPLPGIPECDNPWLPMEELWEYAETTIRDGFTTPEPTSIQHRRDDRDLTFWLFNELREGLRNSDVQLIKNLHGDFKLLNYGDGNTPTHVGLANIYWRALVRNKARYDFKHDIEEELGRTILFRANDGTELWSEFSVPGNIFFGYVGTYIGFTGAWTHLGAGYAQTVDQVKKIQAICDIPRYLPPSTVWYLGDSSNDYRGVEFGIDLWRKYGENLSLFQFRDELEQNHHRFAPPPELAGTGNTPAYGWIYPLKDWPYDVGDFNGDDEKKHWPPRAEKGFGFGDF